MKTDSEIKDLISFLNFYKFRKEEERVAVIVEIKQLFSTEKIELTKKELSSSRFSLCSGMLFFQAQQIFGLLENNQWNYFIKKNNTLWYNLFTHETVSLGSSQVQDLVVISKSDELYYYFETNTSLLYSIDKHLIVTVLVHDYLSFFNPNELEVSIGEKYLFDYETLYNQNVKALEELDVIDIVLFAVSPITLLSHLHRSSKEIKIKIKGSKNKNCCLVPIIENTFGNYQLSYFYKTKKDEPKEIALQLEFTCAEAVMLFLNETILNYYLVNIDLTETDGVLGVFVNQYKTFFIDSISNKIEKEDIWSKREALNLIFCLPEQYTFNPVLGKSVYLPLFKWLVTEGDFNNFGQFKSEDGFIKLLQNIYDSLQTNQDFQSFLNLFLVERKGTPILKYLLKAIDGDNFIVFCNIMEKIWRKTAYINPDLAIYNTIKEEDQGPLLLPYESEKWLGIYIANATVEYDKRIEIKNLGTGQYKEVQRPNPKGGGYYTHKEEITVDYVYHPFYPVYIKNTQENETSLELNSIIPAFMLFANKEKAFWSNVLTISEYAFDIVTTFSGIGNIAKFRHLTKVAKLAEGVSTANKVVKTANILRHVKGVAGVVELTSGSVNLMLKITGAKDSEFGESLSKVLFYLELITLSGELTVSLSLGLKKSAKEAIEASDGALRVKHPELFEELYKIIGFDNLGRKFIYIVNTDEIGRQANKITFKLVDHTGNELGELIRGIGAKGRSTKYQLIIGNKKIDLNSEITLFNAQMGKSSNLPVEAGQEIIYADINIPSEITKQYSGFGEIMLDESLAYFKNNTKFGKVDGNIGYWVRFEEYYKDYGGQSINLKKFWEAVNARKSYEVAAFETFTGKWAKKNGFTKAVIRNVKEDISNKKVVIKFLKE